ncbi:MAG TPA: hypothetical protein VG755_12210 [Nannocystaceae bacterium]|nr:hypothetical protein [Nannocystaceae bacterium]
MKLQAIHSATGSLHLRRARAFALTLCSVVATACGGDHASSIQPLTLRQSEHLAQLGIAEVIDDGDALVLIDFSGAPIGELVDDGSSVEIQLDDELARMQRDGDVLDVECSDTGCTRALTAATILATLGSEYTDDRARGEAPADAAARICDETTEADVPSSTNLQSENPSAEPLVGCLQHIDGCIDWGIYFDGFEMCWNYARCTVNTCSGVYWCEYTWG